MSWVIGQIERIGTPTKYDLHSENFAIGYFKFEANVRGIIESGSDTAPGYHHIYCYGTEGEIELAAPGGPALRIRNQPIRRRVGDNRITFGNQPRTRPNRSD